MSCKLHFFILEVGQYVVLRGNKHTDSIVITNSTGVKTKKTDSARKLLKLIY